VTVRDAAGRVVCTAVTNADGTFSVAAVPPGEHTIAVELPGFETASRRVAMPVTGALPALRFVLRAGGFSEEVVVTGRRVGTRVSNTPQKVEIVDAADLERTVAADITDVLKKNASMRACFPVSASAASVRSSPGSTSGRCC
jgi:hypothetical protein